MFQIMICKIYINHQLSNYPADTVFLIAANVKTLVPVEIVVSVNSRPCRQTAFCKLYQRHVTWRDADGNGMKEIRMDHEL